MRRTQDEAEREVADRICNAAPVCPVKEDCLNMALYWGQDGVAGGTSYEERLIIRRRRKVA